MTESRLDFVRNILAFYGVILVFLMLKFNLDKHAQTYNYWQRLFIIALPLLTSSFFWNWKVYSFLNAAAYKDERSFVKVYLFLTWLLTLTIFIFDIAMTYGVFLKLSGRV